MICVGDKVELRINFFKNYELTNESMKVKQLAHNNFLNVFKDSTYNDGIEFLKITSWEDFHKIIEIFKESRDRYIWRGQRKDWELKSTFDRHPSFNRLTFLDEKGKIRQLILKILFDNFKNKLDELEKENSRFKIIKSTLLVKNPEDYIWATGQHYNLPTPILDWTEDPYIAAFFAFYKRYEVRQNDRVVYALNIKTLKRLLNGSKQRFIELLDLDEKYIGDYELKNRIRKQKSKFTKALNGMSIRKNIKKFTRIKPEICKEKINIITKIFIPDEFRDKCLNYLKTHEKGITNIKLFTDYHGAVDSCKIDIGLDFK